MTFEVNAGIDPVLVWAIGFLAGIVVALIGWLALRATFAQPLFERTNHRGRLVPVGAGIVLFVAVVAVQGLWRFVDAVTGTVDIGSGARTQAVLIAGGFGLFGLFDDLASQGDDRGFRGHLGAMTQGRLTTGGLKLVGGGLLSLVVVSVGVVDASWWRMLLGALVIAFAANTANLLDRAPARCAKVALVCAVPLFMLCDAFLRPGLDGLAIVMGAAVGLIFFDAREQLMLGDAGSNILGAMLGWGLVAIAPWQVQLVVLVVLVALNLISEKVSFSKVIDANPVLRAIDRLGRPSD